LTPEEIEGHWDYSKGLIFVMLEVAEYLYKQGLKHGAKHEQELPESTPETADLMARIEKNKREYTTMVRQLWRAKDGR